MQLEHDEDEDNGIANFRLSLSDSHDSFSGKIALPRQRANHLIILLDVYRLCLQNNAIEQFGTWSIHSHRLNENRYVEW